MEVRSRGEGGVEEGGEIRVCGERSDVRRQTFEEHGEIWEIKIDD